MTQREREIVVAYLVQKASAAQDSVVMYMEVLAVRQHDAKRHNRLVLEAGVDVTSAEASAQRALEALLDVMRWEVAA